MNANCNNNRIQLIFIMPCYLRNPRVKTISMPRNIQSWWGSSRMVILNSDPISLRLGLWICLWFSSGKVSDKNRYLSVAATIPSMMTGP